MLVTVPQSGNLVMVIMIILWLVPNFVIFFFFFKKIELIKILLEC